MTLCVNVARERCLSVTRKNNVYITCYCTDLPKLQIAKHYIGVGGLDMGKINCYIGAI